MSKLFSVLIAVAFAAVTFSAVAAEGAMAPAKPAAAGTAMTPAKPAGKTASPKQRAQRAKMKVCNNEAKSKGLKKAERKAFMKSCMKGDSAAPAAQ